MNCKLCSEQLQDYLEGNLAPTLQQEVERHVKNCTECKRELEQYREMEALFNAPTEEEPDARLRHGFQMMLAAEQSKLNEQKPKETPAKVRNLWPQWSIAASVILFVLGLVLGNTFQPFSHGQQQEVQALRSEIVQMKALVVRSMLEQHSASDRIQAVSHVQDIPGAGQELMKTLIHTLHNDENVNVRLAAVEAMYSFGEEPEVREALIRALEEQQDVMIQLSVIELLVKMQEIQALPVMEDMLKQEQTNEIVKHKLQEGLGRLI
jgi:hypothetical protein